MAETRKIPINQLDYNSDNTLWHIRIIMPISAKVHGKVFDSKKSTG